MTPGALAARNQLAQESIRRSIEKLGAAMGIDTAETFAGVRGNDAVVRALLEREAIAAFLDRWADASGKSIATEIPDIDPLEPLGQQTRDQLAGAGLGDVESIAGATDEQILEIDGIGMATLARIREVAPRAEPEDGA